MISLFICVTSSNLLVVNLFYSNFKNAVTLKSHTRTVVRKCCKGDDASQLGNGNFDPLSRPNPLTDRHETLLT